MIRVQGYIQCKHIHTESKEIFQIVQAKDKNRKRFKMAGSRQYDW